MGAKREEKKKARRKVENGEKKSLVTMFYWTSSKRSRPFWLVIGVIKLLCFSARERAPDLGVISCVLIFYLHAKYKKFSCLAVPGGFIHEVRLSHR